MSTKDIRECKATDPLLGRASSDGSGVGAEAKGTVMSQELANTVRGINEGLRAQFCPTMKIGATVAHPDGYAVKVLSGCYLDPVYGRVSNWWTWQRINDDGTPGEEASGYGW